jgi:hypothetical protein
MGDDVAAQRFSPADRQRYREKVRRCLDVLARMLAEGSFTDRVRRVGLELELDLVDDTGAPALANTQVLEAIGRSDFQAELGQFTVEVNVEPEQVVEPVLSILEDRLRGQLDRAETLARTAGARLMAVGILPTLTPQQLTRESITPNPRFHLLDEQIVAARGETIRIRIDGAEPLAVDADTIAYEAACTSLQLHLQVSPEQFPAYWNAAQAIAGVQLAVGANSPYLTGHRLWDETRIALFEQSTDTRAEELTAQGVRPRVWFGERWISSVLDLFEENVRYFPSLLPILDEEDPVALLDAGQVPRLSELRLHNGTIYRWNRPVYDTAAGQAHLRVENRVLPAGPSVADIMANAALYYGLVAALAEQDPPVWTRLPFTAAAENFHAGARHGLDATLTWPGVGQLPARRLVADHLLPLAEQGLAAWGISAADRSRALGIIEGRCTTGITGASWQSAVVARLEEKGLDRAEALTEMTRRYLVYMHANRPVHTWPLD